MNEVAANAPWVVIPAHNEASVIARCLKGLTAGEGREEATFRIVVVANGCTDKTVKVAAQFASVVILIEDLAGKAGALNRANAHIGVSPRLYLDADCQMSRRDVNLLFAELERGPELARRPVVRYDTSAATRVVRRYYRAKERLVNARPVLWGAGAYAVGIGGANRVSSFPVVTADDLWASDRFGPNEKAISLEVSSVVSVPRNLPAMLSILDRAHRGAKEVGASRRSSLTTAWRALSRGGSLADGVVYIAVAGLVRLRSLMRRGREPVWERDESSRVR